MSALRRVTRTPGLLVALWLFELAVAASFGMWLRSALGAALGKYAVTADGHLLVAIIELLVEHPAIAAQLASAAIGTAAIGAALWTVLAPAMIVRLSGSGWQAAAAAVARWLPAMVVVSLWHLVLRAVLVGLVLLPTQSAPAAVRLVILGLVVLTSTCALDVARTRIVLDNARPFHPRTAWMGYVETLRSPALLSRSLVLSLGQWSAVVAILTIASFGLGAVGTLLIVRSLALVGLFLGLLRMAVVVDRASPGV